MYSIVDEQLGFLVLNKHQGVCVHTEDDEIGLIEQLRKDFGSRDIFPVHRLDKVTSGLLLCAKSQAANSELSQLFQHRQVNKYYLAISDQKPKKKQGLIIGDMERSRRGAWKLCHTKNNPAITQFFSQGLGDGKRLYLLKPTTGKTHQLRVALKSIGSPIIGDRLYGHPEELAQGIYLHAFAIEFMYAGQSYRYVNPPRHWEGKQAGKLEKSQWAESFSHCLCADYAEPWLLPWPNR